MKVKTGVPFLIMATSLSLTAQAAEYSVTPFASATAQADTNNRLTVRDADTIFAMLFDAGALFSRESEETIITATPRIAISRFSDDGTGFDQDAENYYFDLNGNHRFNERFSAGGFFSYANVGVVSAELEDVGLVLGNSDIFATGELFAPQNFSRQTMSFGPSMTYIFTERDSLQLGGSFTDASYDRQDTGLADYASYSLNASWIRQINVTDQFVASIFALNQNSELDFLVRNSAGPDPLSLINEYDQIGFSLGYVRSFSETLTGKVTIGTRMTDGQFPDLIDFDISLSAESAALINPNTGLPVGSVLNRLDPLLSDPVFLRANPDFLARSRTVNRIYRQGSVNATGLLIDASVEKLLYETTTLIAGLSRSSIPTGRGLTERDEVYLNATHLFSDRLTGKGSFRYFSTQSESEQTLAAFNVSTDQIRLEAGLDWRWTEFWTVSGGYTYARRSSENSDAADGHGLFVTVGYNGNKHAISR